jgi:cis-3-alkyl-4-acyloxetan-2-one decarboxylase
VGGLFLRHNVFARAAARFGMRRAMPAQVREGYLRPYGTPRDRVAILRFVQDIPLSSADRAWTELLAAERATKLLANRPVFVGWGERDPVFRHAFLDEWRRRFPDAMCRVYPRGGHYVLEDQPELISEITAFLGTAA